MIITEFKITNYRSIIETETLKIDKELTVLLGNNNEGKSNVLKALKLVFKMLEKRKDYYDYFIKYDFYSRHKVRKEYDWEVDFPISLQQKNAKKTSPTTFDISFHLNENEQKKFRKIISYKSIQDLILTLKLIKKKYDGYKIDYSVSIHKEMSDSMKKKFKKKNDEIVNFIAQNFECELIPTIRTENDAKRVIFNSIERELEDITYKITDKYESEIEETTKKALSKIEKQLKETLPNFIPSVKNVKIEKENRRFMRRRFDSSYDKKDFELYVNDGVNTTLSYKGDGIKSLVVLALMKQQKDKEDNVIFAIEEPESHLHPGAIHQIKSILTEASKNHQIIISTHSPIMVNKEKTNANLIVKQNSVIAAENIMQIRNSLGVELSDNLQSAEFILLVEGKTDKIALKNILLSCHSDIIKKSIINGTMIIREIDGASHLKSELIKINNELFKYFCFLDNDKDADNAIKIAIEKGVLKNNQYLKVITNNKYAELEDLFKIDSYKNLLKEKYNVNIDKRFRVNKSKFSDRLKKLFESEGLLFNKEIENEIKLEIARLTEMKNLNFLIKKDNNSTIKKLIECIEKELNNSNNT